MSKLLKMLILNALRIYAKFQTFSKKSKISHKDMVNIDFSVNKKYETNRYSFTPKKGNSKQKQNFVHSKHAFGTLNAYKLRHKS